MIAGGSVYTPQAAGLRQPAEWEPHRACWLAWPSHADLWQEHLAAVRSEFVALCRAIADPDPVTGVGRGETLEILVPDEAAQAEAQAALAALPVRFHRIPFGDIWLRDTGPIFLVGAEGALATVRFAFNGWGGKYLLRHDSEVAAGIVAALGLPRFRFPWVLEGGAVESDGEGTCLTTRQCLLNANRNPRLSQAELEVGLKQALGIERVLWLQEGLLNDHTDGHIDNLARFVAPGVVLCMRALAGDDPNREVLAQIASDLAAFTDARGRRLQVIQMPSPGKVLDEAGQVMPASYLNFYIGNRSVVVPIYGTPYDAAALAAIAQCFPKHRTVGLSAQAILRGGGSFHCITQPQPLTGSF